MPQRDSLRASDADREQIAERLREAAAEGRLLAEELEHRLGTAFKARTYGELDSVVADLPGTTVERRSSIGVLRPVMMAAVVIAVVAAIALAALVIMGLLAMGGLWVLVAWWIFGGHCTGARRRRYSRRHVRFPVEPASGPAEPRAWL
jgi:hypothetical protein